MSISDSLSKIETLLNISFTSGPMRVSPPKNQQIIAGIKLRFPQHKWEWNYSNFMQLPSSFIISKNDKVIFDCKLGTDGFYTELVNIIENLILEEKLNILLDEE